MSRWSRAVVLAVVLLPGVVSQDLLTSQVQVPSVLMGQWSGELIKAPYSVGFLNNLSISTPDSEGNVYLTQLHQHQLMRVQSDLMQYCFGFGNSPQPELDVEAPFVVSPSLNNRTVTFCWRGPRLPSHAANCTGCDCAKWALELDAFDNLQSTFYMSPPVVHLAQTLTRVGPAPSAHEILGDRNCKFNNHTGHIPKPPTKTRCPFAAALPSPTATVPKADSSGAVHNCLIMNSKYNTRLECVSNYSSISFYS